MTALNQLTELDYCLQFVGSSKQTASSANNDMVLTQILKKLWHFHVAVVTITITSLRTEIFGHKLLNKASVDQGANKCVFLSVLKRPKDIFPQCDWVLNTNFSGEDVNYFPYVQFWFWGWDLMLRVFHFVLSVKRNWSSWHFYIFYKELIRKYLS